MPHTPEHVDEGLPFTAENVLDFLSRPARRDPGRIRISPRAFGAAVARGDIPAPQPARRRHPRLRTVGDLRRLAQGLRGVPETLRTRILSRMLGLPDAPTATMDALNRILFRHQLAAPERRAEERRFQERKAERRITRAETRKFREESREIAKKRFEATQKATKEARKATQEIQAANLELREREFQFRQRETERQVLKSLEEISRLKNAAKLAGNTEALAVFERVEGNLLSRLIRPRAKVTRVGE